MALFNLLLPTNEGDDQEKSVVMPALDLFLCGLELHASTGFFPVRLGWSERVVVFGYDLVNEYYLSCCPEGKIAR